MSKHINVNPDHYKVSGRERPGDAIPHEQNKERASKAEHQLRQETKRKGGREQQRPRNRKA